MSTRAESASIKNCAAAHGVGERAVRQWRAKRDPRWIAWQAKEARAVSQPELAVGCVTTSPESEEQAAAGRFVALQRLVDSAMAGGNHTGLPILLKNAQEAQKLLAGCRAAAIDHATATGRLIPRSQVEPALIEYASNVKSRLQLLPDRIRTLFPTLTDEIDASIRAEVAEVMHAASQLSLLNGPSE